MAAKKGDKKKSAKKKSVKAKKKAVHRIKVTGGKPVPRHLAGVHKGDKVAFTKADKADRFADFANSPFLTNEGPQKIKIPGKKTVAVDPVKQKSYHYDILDKDGNIISVKGSGPPNPPEIVVG